jgi:hypothetical protein
VTELTQPNLWQYPARTGETAAQDISVLLSEPEIHLTDAERNEARAFGYGLAAGQVGAITCQAREKDSGTSISLVELGRKSVTASEYTYYSGYFETEKGQSDLEILGADTGGNLQQFLAKKVATGEKVEVSARRKASMNSEKWYKDTLAAQLAEDPATDKDFVEPESFAINFKPEGLIDKFAALREYKVFFGQVWHQLREEPVSNLRQAKEAQLRIHVAKVNHQMAIMYPNAINLARQLAASPTTDQTEVWATELMRGAPISGAVLRQENEGDERRATFVDGFARRLDLLRYGAVYNGPHRNYSPISTKIYELPVPDRGSEELLESVLDSADIEAMEQKEWGAEELAELLKAVLNKWDLGSSQEISWEALEDRQGPADDGKVQVVITPKQSSLEYLSKKKVLLVPKEFKRKLVQQNPAGALIVASHELTHVLQGEASDELAEDFPIAAVNGRRPLLMHEYGGLHQESAFLQALGMRRGRNMFYLRGLEQKMDGGNIAQVIRAVHLAHNESEQSDSEEARRTSVDQTLRLYRHAGQSSQQIDYVEQELVEQALQGQPEELIQRIAIYATNFALMDSAELHRVGLFDIPNPEEVRIPWKTVLEVYQEQFRNKK